MERVIILLFILAFTPGFSAPRRSLMQLFQINEQDTLKIWDKLTIQSDPIINELLRQQTAQSKKSGTLSGYRLQIYFGSGAKAHTQAIKIKTEFLSSHPDIMAVLLFKSPDFIVRIGNFRSKSEALKMQKSLGYQYPNAFIVADEIAFPELIKLTINN
jgi:hypothetical protein